MKTRTVFVVEDEPDIRDMVVYNLQRDGFATTTIETGEGAVDAIRTAQPVAVLLDLMLPGVDGLEICRRLKSDEATNHIAVIMVSAKGEESDIVLGLGLGADDYIVKPFRPKELLARLRAVLRRTSMPDKDSGRGRVVRRGLTVDASRHEVLVDDERVEFTATEFKLLHFLASRPGRVFTRDQLLDRVMGGDAIVVDRNIDVHIRAIRRKLGPRRDLIATIRGVGYRFIDDEG